MMALLNQIAELKSITRGEFRILLCLLSPFAPHLAEELWEILRFGGMICEQIWPAYDEAKCREDSIEVAVQVNGRLRSRLTLPAGASSEEAIAAAKADERIAEQLTGKTIVKEIYVKGKLINLVVRG